MKKLAPLAVLILASCGYSRVERLEKENAALKVQLEETQMAAMKVASESRIELIRLSEKLAYETKRADTYYEKLSNCN